MRYIFITLIIFAGTAFSLSSLVHSGDIEGDSKQTIDRDIPTGASKPSNSELPSLENDKDQDKSDSVANEVNPCADSKKSDCPNPSGEPGK